LGPLFARGREYRIQQTIERLIALGSQDRFDPIEPKLPPAPGH
jgi:hypothetical protein